MVEWGIGVLDALQQADLLQQRLHESSFSSETENRNELDDHTLPCPTVVARWLLRDMWKQSERGCTPQGQESTEQQYEQLDASVSELPQQNSSTCEDLFDMWEKGEGIRLLQQALHQIQEIWKPTMGEWEGGDRMNEVSKMIVRRLTPL